ncbi:putative carboxylesterase 2 [Tasmannia lanceolata]|uniref:putative carboxylesterase 2 n=1 Tax=Tasmannia lanceolata TaxID=3420 RepID=UPI00406326A1
MRETEKPHYLQFTIKLKRLLSPTTPFKNLTFLLSHLFIFLFFFSSLLFFMDPSKEIAHDFPSFLRVYKDGRIERLTGTQVVPPGLDPRTGVTSKDVVIVPESGVSARLYIPKLSGETPKKIPLLVYFHGGGFMIESPFSPLYHTYLNSLVAEANVVAVSVDYRLCPEHPITTVNDDSWATLLWVASHGPSGPGGPEPWITDHADFDRVMIAGDSAGANISHHMAMRGGPDGLGHGVHIKGAIVVNPYFWGSDPIGSEGVDPLKKESVDGLWLFVCPSNLGCDDPLINPVAPGAPSLSGLGCTRVLICVAEKDVLKDRGQLYHDALRESGWRGEVEFFETKGKDHVFHLFNPDCEEAGVMLKRLASFMNDF